jgi:uncharacterized protein involved in exopolysaccharide biosynthesis
VPVYEEIDLRPYIQALLAHWWQIALAGVVAGVLAFVVMLFIPPTYESSALVLVTKPRFNLQFDPRIQTPDATFAYLAYPTLALSDVVVDELVAAVSPQSAEVLRQRLSSKNGTDPSLIVLTVSHNDPVRAAEIANAWSELFVSRANQVFGQQGDEPVRFLQAQLTRTEAQLEAIDSQLAAFQAENPLQLLATELASSLQAQAAYLLQQRQTADLQRDVAAYAVQFDSRYTSEVLSTADVTALTLLQARAFGMAGETTSLLLDVSGGGAGVAEMTGGDGAAVLASLQEVLALRQASLEEELAVLEPQIVSTQERLQIATSEQKRLQGEQDLVFATYTTLGRTLDEVMITAEDTTGQVRLASYAGVAKEPVGPRKLVAMMLSAFIACLASVGWVIGRQWWKSVT